MCALTKAGGKHLYELPERRFINTTVTVVTATIRLSQEKKKKKKKNRFPRYTPPPSPASTLASANK